MDVIIAFLDFEDRLLGVVVFPGVVEHTSKNTVWTVDLFGDSRIDDAVHCRLIAIKAVYCANHAVNKKKWSFLEAISGCP